MGVIPLQTDASWVRHEKRPSTEPQVHGPPIPGCPERIAPIRLLFAPRQPQSRPRAVCLRHRLALAPPRSPATRADSNHPAIAGRPSAQRDTPWVRPASLTVQRDHYGCDGRLVDAKECPLGTMSRPSRANKHLTGTILSEHPSMGEPPTRGFPRGPQGRRTHAASVCSRIAPIRHLFAPCQTQSRPSTICLHGDWQTGQSPRRLSPKISITA